MQILYNTNNLSITTSCKLHSTNKKKILIIIHKQENNNIFVINIYCSWLERRIRWKTLNIRILPVHWQLLSTEIGEKARWRWCWSVGSKGNTCRGSKKRGRRRDVSDRCASECALNPRPTWTRIYEVEANGKKKTRRKGNSRVSWPYRVNPSNIHNETRDYKSIRNSKTFHLLQIYFVYDYLFENEYKEKIWILFSCESQLLSKDRCNYLYEKFYDFIRLFILIEWSKRWKLKIHDI